MAHNAIPLTAVQLVDCWPGAVNPNIGKPVGGWDGTADCFKTTAINTPPGQPVGQKRMAYTDNTHCPGWYTMMYLQYHSFENACVSKDMSDSLQLCTPYDGSDCEWFDNSHTPYFVVTNEITLGNSDATRGMRIAFPCATMDSDGTSCDPSANNAYGDQWGWFWIGGVCPCKDATILDGTAGSGFGVEFGCASTYTGGPMTLDDFSTDGTTGYVFFKEAVSDATVAFVGIRNSPIVAYGDISGS